MMVSKEFSLMNTENTKAFLKEFQDVYEVYQSKLQEIKILADSFYQFGKIIGFESGGFYIEVDGNEIPSFAPSFEQVEINGDVHIRYYAKDVYYEDNCLDETYSYIDIPMSFIKISSEFDIFRFRDLLNKKSILVNSYSIVTNDNTLPRSYKRDVEIEYQTLVLGEKAAIQDKIEHLKAQLKESSQLYKASHLQEHLDNIKLYQSEIDMYKQSVKTLSSQYQELFDKKLNELKENLPSQIKDVENELDVLKNFLEALFVKYSINLANRSY